MGAGRAARAGSAGRCVVVQAVILREGRVLLAVRADLRGWELPGGAPQPGESDAAALAREVREETGLAVEILRRVGDYRRSGFRPHLARVFACRVVGGAERPSPETPRLRWFDAAARRRRRSSRGIALPLADALAGHAQPVARREHQGAGRVLAGLRDRPAHADQRRRGRLELDDGDRALVAGCVEADLGSEALRALRRSAR